MFGRLTLGSAALAMGLAMILPATTMAAVVPHRVVVLQAACTTEHGLYGYGKVVLKLQALAQNIHDDVPDTNYFIFNSRRQEKVAGVWMTVEHSVVQSTFSPDFDDGGPVYFNAVNKMKYDFMAADHPRTRILMRVEFWDERPGADVRLNAIGERTAAC